MSVSVELAGGKVTAGFADASLSLQSGGESPAAARYKIQAPAPIEVDSAKGELGATGSTEIGVSAARDAEPGWVEIQVALMVGEEQRLLRVPYRIAR